MRVLFRLGFKLLLRRLDEDGVMQPSAFVRSRELARQGLVILVSNLVPNWYNSKRGKIGIRATCGS